MQKTYAIKAQNITRFYTSETVLGNCDSLQIGSIRSAFEVMASKGPRFAGFEIIDIEVDEENDAADVAVKTSAGLEVFVIEIAA